MPTPLNFYTIGQFHLQIQYNSHFACTILLSETKVDGFGQHTLTGSVRYFGLKVVIKLSFTVLKLKHPLRRYGTTSFEWLCVRKCVPVNLLSTQDGQQGAKG